MSLLLRYMGKICSLCSQAGAGRQLCKVSCLAVLPHPQTVYGRQGKVRTGTVTQYDPERPKYRWLLVQDVGGGAEWGMLSEDQSLWLAHGYKRNISALARVPDNAALAAAKKEEEVPGDNEQQRPEEQEDDQQRQRQLQQLRTDGAADAQDPMEVDSAAGAAAEAAAAAETGTAADAATAGDAGAPPPPPPASGATVPTVEGGAGRGRTTREGTGTAPAPLAKGGAQSRATGTSAESGAAGGSDGRGGRRGGNASNAPGHAAAGVAAPGGLPPAAGSRPGSYRYVYRKRPDSGNYRTQIWTPGGNINR